MAFKPVTNCKWCKRVKADKELFNRLNRSKEYVPSGEALSVIAKEIDPGGYRGLINHVKIHQAPKPSYLKRDTEARETKKALQDIKLAEQKRQVKLADKTRQFAEYTGNQSATRGQVIDKLLGMAMDGSIKWTGGNLVSLLAQEQKAEEAAKDRQFEMEKMVYHFIAQGGDPRDYLKYNQDALEGEVVPDGTSPAT